MNIRDAKTLANKYMKLHGLKAQGWVLELDQAKTRAGYCSYRRRVISLSEPITLLNPKDKVMNTILHEIAHALTQGSGHGRAWKELAIAIGCDGQRCFGDETVTPPAKYITYCPNGHTGKRHRKPRTIMSCGRCSSVFNPKLLLKCKLNTEGV